MSPPLSIKLVSCTKLLPAHPIIKRYIPKVVKLQPSKIPIVSIADTGIAAMIMIESSIELNPLKYVAQYPGIFLLLHATLVRNIPSHMNSTAMKIVTTLNTVSGYHFSILAIRNCHKPLTMMGVLYPGSAKKHPLIR